MAPQPSRPLVTPKDIVWLTLLFPATWLTRLLPLSWLYPLGDALAASRAALLRRSRKGLLRALSAGLDADPASPELHAIAAQFIRNRILCHLDDLLIVHRFPDLHWPNVEVVHLDYLTQALSAGKGALLLNGHFYASRVAKRYLAATGFRSLSVRNHAPPYWAVGQFGNRFLRQRFTAFLGAVLGDEVSSSDPDCSLKMLARLRAGGLIDYYVEARISREQVTRRVLGRDRTYAAGFLHVARLAGCPLVPMRCAGNSRRLRIEFGEPFELQDAPDRRTFVETNMAVILRNLEEQIKSNPAEWYLWAS